MSKNFCSNCGEPLEEEANFCANCGQQIKTLEKKSNKDENNKVGNNYIPNKFNKIWGHLAIGILSLFLVMIGISTFEAITENMFGYYTPDIIEIIASIVIGFIIASILVLIPAVYAIKLNLLIFKKEKIAWRDILLKDINFFNNIFSFIGSYFLLLFINIGLIII